MTIGIPQVVDGPVPVARPYGLLSVVGAPSETGERWIGGVTVDRYRIGPATISVIDDCGSSPGVDFSDDLDTSPGANTGDTESFLVSSGLLCTGQMLTDQAEFIRRASVAVEAVEMQAVEQEFYSAAGIGQESLRSTAAIADAGPHTLVAGLGVLEQVFGEETAQRGILHASARIATHLAQNGGIVRVGDHMETAIGTPVAISAGYDGAMPLDDDGSTRDGADTNGAGEEYIYMSGMVQVRRSNLWVPDADPADALRRSDNQAFVHTQRWYNVLWDHDAVWALQVTRPAN